METIHVRAALIALSALFLAEASAQPASRTTTSFDHDWRYWAGDAAGVEEAAFNDGAWTPIDLPHDWSIAQAFDEHAPAGGAGGFLPTGVPQDLHSAVQHNAAPILH